MVPCIKIYAISSFCVEQKPEDESTKMQRIRKILYSAAMNFKGKKFSSLFELPLLAIVCTVVNFPKLVNLLPKISFILSSLVLLCGGCRLARGPEWLDVSTIAMWVQYKEHTLQNRVSGFCPSFEAYPHYVPFFSPWRKLLIKFTFAPRKIPFRISLFRRKKFTS